MREISVVTSSLSVSDNAGADPGLTVRGCLGLAPIGYKRVDCAR